MPPRAEDTTTNHHRHNHHHEHKEESNQVVKNADGADDDDNGVVSPPLSPTTVITEVDETPSPPPTSPSPPPTTTTSPQQKRLDRSVIDYNSLTEVIEALQTPPLPGSPDEVDWKLTIYNHTISMRDPNNIEKEAKRLLCLKSYNILDTNAPTTTTKQDDIFYDNDNDDNFVFDCITKEAQQVFDCPIAVISLVDMGRQWFKSIQGLEGVESTPRCIAFCSHVIKQKYPMDVMIVPDATKDIRFQNNPLVADPNGLQIKFYAGTSLLTPEGQCIGTICIIDTKPHPEGLTTNEKSRLQAMAQEIVLQLIVRL